MTGFEAYHVFNSLRLHFQSETYDYFKYHKKVKTSVQAFRQRKDQYFYEKLAKHRDVERFVLANMIDGDYAKWIGGLVQEKVSEDIYLTWLKRQQSLSYMFSEELNKVPDLEQAVKVTNGQHPLLLKMFLDHSISYETIIILSAFGKFLEHWDEKIDEKFLWPTISLKIRKYRPFISFDREKMKNIIYQALVAQKSR